MGSEVISEPQRTYLLELLTALGAAADGLVLVGGQALRFMVARPRGTRDFDFVLDVAYLRGCDTSIAPILESLGYDSAKDARNFQFEKRIPNSAEVMRIEFMAPDEFAKKNEIRVNVQAGVHGRACVGGAIVVVETEDHELVGALPNGTPVKTKIHVTRPHAFVLLKLLAMDDRYHNLRGPSHAEHDREEARIHASDIVAVMSAQANLGEFRRAFCAQFGDKSTLKTRTDQIIRNCFRDESSPGLVLYAESITASLPLGESRTELGIELRRAQRLVSTLILD